MKINILNKDTLIIDEFKFKCSIGKKGFVENKVEGDKKTPLGTYKLGKLYYRKDRLLKPETSIPTRVIKRNYGWCNDPKSKFYNKEYILNKKICGEKLYRKDYKYNYFIEIKYNSKKVIPGKGSAIFLHLTKDYKPTVGCIAVDLNAMLIILKLVNKNSTIKIG